MLPGVGRKTAERLSLELADRVQDLDIGGEVTPVGVPRGVHDAVQALVSLGMSFQDADRVVRRTLEDDPGLEMADLVRKALALK